MSGLAPRSFAAMTSNNPGQNVMLVEVRSAHIDVGAHALRSWSCERGPLAVNEHRREVPLRNP